MLKKNLIKEKLKNGQRNLINDDVKENKGIRKKCFRRML